jgi:RHS repeat-associated protein
LSVGTFADVGATSHHDSIAYTAIFRYGVDLNNSYIDHFLLDEHDAGGVKTAQFPSMPTRPRARAVFPGTVVLNVAASSTVTISSTTAYAAIDVGEGAVLNLQSGDYPIDLLTVRDNARLTALGPVTVRVARRVFGGEGARLTVASGLSAKDLRIEALGKNGGAGLPGSLPQAIDLDDLSTAQAILFAPNGTVRLGKLSETTGAVIARDVFLDERAELTYQDGLAPLSGSLPLAFNDEYGATEDQPLVIDAEGVLLNDLDPSYATLTATITAFTVNGTVAFASDGSFVYAPNENFEGEDHFSYTAIGPGGESVTATVTILVDGTNDVPVIRSFPVGSTFVGSVWQYTVECEDPDDGDTLEYALIDAPSGVSLTGNVVSFTPSSSDIGELELGVSCTDSQDAYDTQHVSFTVLTSPAPESFVLYAKQSIQFRGTTVDGSIGVLESGSYAGPRAVVAGIGVVGQVRGADLFAHSVALQAGSHVQDVYTHTVVSNSALEYGEIREFPSMPTFPSISSVSTGTGTVTLATNTQVTISSTKSWSVFDVGADARMYLEPGVHHVGDVTVAEGGAIMALGPIELRISGRLLLGNYAYIGPAEGMSTGPQDVRIEVSGYNNGMGVFSSPVAAETRTQSSIIGTLIVPNGTAIFGWRTVGWGAFYAKDIYTNDHTLFFKGAAEAENTPPLIVSTPSSSINEGSLYSYQIVVSDALDDEHEYFVDSAPLGLTAGATGLVSWTPDNDDVGLHNILVRVRDSGGLEDTQSFQLTVVNINNSPAFTSSADTSAEEDQLYSYVPTASDPDGTTPSITLVEGPIGMSLIAGTLIWTPVQANVMSHPVVLAATDGVLTVTQNYHLVVSATNDVPTFSVTPPTTATEDELYSFQLRVTDPDPNEAHTYTFLANPSGMQIVAPGNIIQWTPGNEDLGEHDVSVQVQDSAFASALLNFQVTVSNANDAPVFTNTPPTTAVENVEFDFTVTAEDPDEGDTITFALDSGPDGAVFDDAEFSWTPDDDQVGTFTIIIRASDVSGAFALQTVDVVVANANDAPVFDPIPAQNGSEDQIFRYQIHATDADSSDSLEYTLVSAPDGMAITEATGEITWTAPESGEYEVTVRVDDSHVQVEGEFSLEIVDVNDPPSIMNEPELHAKQGELYSFALDVYDEESSWSAYLDVAPPGMTLLSNVVSWTPGGAQVGSFAVVVRVVDEHGEIDILSFVVHVANTNDAPVFTTLAPTTVEENQVYRYQARATDPDGEAVTFQLVSGPLHLTATPNGLVSWRPVTQQIGLSDPVVLSVTDSHAESTTQTWNIEVTGAPCSGSSAARCSALAWTHVTSREGVPIAGVTVQQNEAFLTQTTELTVSTLLGTASAGEHRWWFTKGDYVPVYREESLLAEDITWIPSVRMAPISDLVGTIQPSGGELERDDVLALSFPNGAVETASLIRVAILDGQSLPAVLPRGWSPASALWLEMEGDLEPGMEITARFTLPAPLETEDELVLVGFDENDRRWEVVSAPSATNLSTAPQVEAILGNYSGHALLVSDGEIAIPSPGQPLTGLSSSDLPALTSATGEVVPEYQMVSQTIDDMTGRAQVTLTHADPLPSGIILPGRLFETYVFANGTEREVPSLDLGIAFYRYPPVASDAPNTLSATFPVRPRVLLQPAEGTDAHQRIEISAGATFDGAPVDDTGGVIAEEGISLTIPENGFSGNVLVSMSALPAEAMRFERAATILAFRVDWTGAQLDSDTALTLDATVVPNESYVLARQETIEGTVGWAPVQRYTSNDLGVLESAETGDADERLPGINAPGTYALFGIDVAEYAVCGEVTDGSDPLSGAIVEVEGRPWIVRSNAVGRYATLAYPGTVIVHGREEGTNNNGSATGQLAAIDPDPEIHPLNLPLVIAEQAPRVIRVSPTGNAASIISAIEVFFSEPVQRTSLPEDAVFLVLDEGDVEVDGSYRLSNDRRSISFLSDRHLAYSTDYTIQLPADLRDDSSNPITGTLEFDFKTVAASSAPTGRARLISYAPGSQDTPCNGLPFFDKDDLGLTCVMGEAGTADSHVPVILVNEESGMTVTTDSTETGSFLSFIRATKEDLLSAVFINRNGTRLTIPLELQHFDDGSVALYRSGGVVDADNPLHDELADFELLVEPNAISRRSVLKMTGRSAAETLELAGTEVDEEIGTVIFGATIQYDGPALMPPADVRFPVSLGDFGLTEETVQDVGFILTEIRHIRVNGQNVTVYETLDRMQYDNGALATHSFPMLGLAFQILAPELAQDYNNLTDPIHHLAVLMTAYAPAPVAGLVVACPRHDEQGRVTDCGLVEGLVEAAATVDPFFYALPPGGRRLPGAIVMAIADDSTVDPLLPFRPAALNPGQIVSIADGLGRYSLALPALHDTPYRLRAIHMDFPGEDASAGVDFSRFSVLGGSVFAHLMFDRLSLAEEVDSGPTLTISHSPTRPVPWTTSSEQPVADPHERTIVRLTAYDEQDVPAEHELTVYDVQSLVPGVAVSPNDVHIGPRVYVDFPGERRRAATFEVTSEVPAIVRFHARVEAGAKSTHLTYPIYFSDDEPEQPNEEPSPEPNDNTGPKVDRSWPPQNAVAVQPGTAIAVTFNEPISRSVLTNSAAMELFPDAGTPSLFLSPDQRTLEIAYPALSVSQQDYSLVLTSVITDLRGNALDQNPATTAADGYTLNFQTVAFGDTAIPPGSFGPAVPGGLGLGSGSVVHGAYAFVADRTNGLIRVYDISDPLRPAAHGVIDLPDGYPRDLVLIPGFSFVRPTTSCVTGSPYFEEAWTQGFENAHGVITSGCIRRNRNLLAVVGGLYNPRFSTQGGSSTGYAGYNNIGAAEGQYLRIIDVTNVYDFASVEVIASSLISIEPTASVGRLKWSPPALSYIEWSSQISSINVVNLQEYIFGMHMTVAHFTALGALAEHNEALGAAVEGTDFNGDGDYVDPNELLPMPGEAVGGSVSAGFAGRMMQVAPSRTNQMIQAYDFSGPRMFIASLLSSGYFRNSLGVIPSNPADRVAVPAEYQTMAADGLQLGHVRSAVHAFGGAVITLDAVAYLPEVQLPILTEEGISDDPIDLVIAGMQIAGPGATVDTQNRLFLLDVTNSHAPPTLLAPLEGIEIPASAGRIQTIELDPLFSSTLRVFTSEAIVTLDMGRLTMPANGSFMHPAITGVTQNVGSTHSAHGASNFGVHVLSDVQRIRFTGPQLHFVSFPQAEEVVSPRSFVLSNPTSVASLDSLQDVFSAVQLETDLRPSRVHGPNGSFSSEVVPGAPETHFHVLMYAPGSAGEEVDLLLEALNDSGHPLPNRQVGFAPVRAAREETLRASDQLPNEGMNTIRSLKAVRLSSDPSSSYYNVYLSDPIAFVYEKVTPQNLATLRVLNGEPREIYHTGYAVRVSVDQPTSRSNVLDSFSSRVDPASKQILLGAAVQATTFPGHRIVGPNPSAIGGSVRAPGTQEMVAVHNGEMQLDKVDFELPGRSMPIELERHYTGQDLFHGGFGPGWDFNLNQRIVELRPANVPLGMEIPVVDRGGPTRDTVARSGDVLFYNGEGDTIHFSRHPADVPSEFQSDPLIDELGWLDDDDSWYLPEAGVFEALVRFRTGQFARLTADGTQYWYTPLGRLEKIYHRYALNRIDLVYNERGELRTVVDRSVSAPRYLELGYYRASAFDLFEAGLDEIAPQRGSLHRIARIRDYTGDRDCLYSYDLEGRLTDVRFPEIKSPGPEGFVGRRTVRYFWAQRGLGITGVIDGSDGGVAAFGATVNAAEQVSSGNGAEGDVTINVQHGNRARDLAGGQARVSVVKPGVGTTDYTLNERGLPTQVAETADGPPETTGYSYESDLLIKRITFPKGNWVEYVYDSENVNLRSRANVLEIRRSGGAVDQLEAHRSLHYDERYNLLQGDQRDFENNLIGVSLENEGRDISEVEYSSYGFASSTHHDASTGQLRSETSEEGIEETYDYDESTGFLVESTLGQVSTEFAYAGCVGGDWGLPCSAQLPLSASVELNYNEMSQQTLMKKGDYRILIGHNRNGDPTKIQRFYGGSTPQEEGRTYDQQGALLTRTELGAETTAGSRDLAWGYERDPRRRLTDIVSPSGETESYTYDFKDRVRSRTLGGYVEEYGYDWNGNLATITIGDAIERRHYDGFDRLSRIEHPAGGETQIFYNKNDHVIGIQVRNPSVGEILRNYQVASIDELGRPRTWTEDTDSYNASYHPQVQLSTEITSPRFGLQISRYDTGGRAEWEEVRSSVPGGRALYAMDFVLDAEGRPDEIRRIEGDADTTYVTDLEYNDLGQMTAEKDSLGTRATYTNRLDGVRTGVSIHPTINDSLTTGTPHTSMGEPAGRVSPTGVTTQLTYDALRRLETVGLANNPPRQFSYAEHRLISQRERDTSSIRGFGDFDARNRPKDLSLPGGSIDATYDLAGRLLTQTPSFGGYAETETFGYDALNRIRSASLGNTRVTFDYNTRGTMTRGVLTQGDQYRWQATDDANGDRASLTYPSPGPTIEYARSHFGRLEGMTAGPSDSIVSTMEYATAELPSRVVTGPVERVDSYDDRQRLMSRKYTVGATARAELRYHYDGADRELARQYLHRAARTDLFEYDDDSRVKSIEVGARLQTSEQSSTVWTVNVGDVPGVWRPGFYARTYTYDSSDEDRVVGTDTSVWPGETAPKVVVSMPSTDTLGHVSTVDTLNRTRDGLGNTTRTELLPGPGNLKYDGMSRLREVTTHHGAVITYSYRSDGPLAGRTVVCGSAPNCQNGTYVYVYDGLTLLAEYEVSSARQLRSLYYYDEEEDIPVAADFWDGTAMRRHYFVTDRIGSVIGVLNAQGAWVERVQYDLWGRPTIESADTQAPRLSTVVAVDGDLRLIFTEAVLPKATIPGSGLATTLGELSDAFTIALRDDVDEIDGVFQLEESAEGYERGTVVRFTPGLPISPGTQLDVTVVADTLVDGWSNANEGRTVEVTTGGAPPTGPPQEVTIPLERSLVGNSLLFQSHLYDYDTDLVHMRARVFDPHTGLFLQLDPEGYTDSPNLYAGLGHDTVNHRDPTGAKKRGRTLEVSSPGKQRTMKKATGPRTPRAKPKVGRGASQKSRMLAKDSTSATRGRSRADHEADEALSTRGSLDRKNGVVLNKQIAGGVPKGYEGHHLISVHIAKDYGAMHDAARMGYNINRRQNGIALPSTIREAKRSGLPLHKGRHLHAGHAGSADQLARRKLGALQNRRDQGLIDDSELMDEVGRVEDAIRDALENRRVRLQAGDPHWK